MKNSIILGVICLFSLNIYAILGPIPITLESEYRTTNPVIGSIASTIRFNSDDIAKSGANTFLELLGNIPDVGVFNPQGNIPSLFLRGNEAKHTLVLVDGIKVHDISSPDGAVGHVLRAIPLAQIDRIEIVKGPYSALYGSGAIGGVIQVFTKRDKSDQTSKFNINYSTHNTKQISFNSGVGGADGFISVSGSKYSTNGISAREDNDEKDGISEQSFGFSIGYNVSDDTDFALNFLTSNNNTDYDNCFSETLDGNHCLFEDSLNKLHLLINYRFNNTIKTKLSFADIEQERLNILDNIGSLFGNASYKTKDLTWLNEISLDSALLSIGLSKVKDTNINSGRELSTQDIFFQWQQKITNIDINNGLRFISHDEFGSELVYNFGIAKYLNNDVKLSASYGSAFNAPTIYQLYNNQDFATGNPNLEPETSKNAELGIAWRALSIRLYKSKVNDLIIYRNTETFDYINEDELDITGVELGVVSNIGGYHINFSHNFTKSELKSSSTQQLRRPKNITNLVINKNYQQFDYSLQLIKKSSSLDTGNIKLSGYILVNAKLHYQYNKNTAIDFGINNAFDKDYTIANGFNQLGRVIKLALNYQF